MRARAIDRCHGSPHVDLLPEYDASFLLRHLPTSTFTGIFDRGPFLLPPLLLSRPHALPTCRGAQAESMRWGRFRDCRLLLPPRPYLLAPTAGRPPSLRLRPRATHRHP